MLTLLLLIPLTSAFAYTGGLLNGLPVYIGTSHIDTTGGQTTSVTDNNETSTSIYNSTYAYYWYAFSTPKSISAYKIKTVTTLNIVLKIYNSSGTWIADIPVITDGVERTFTTVSNVTKVVLFNSTGISSNIAEMDVYDLFTDTTAPANVSNLVASNVAYTSASLNFTTSSDTDFDKYKIYKDGILLYTSIAGIQKNYPISYSVTGLTATTSYVFKVTTLDLNGNESIGQTVNVTTLTPDLTAPDVPINLIISGSNGSALFTWDAVNSVDLKGYFIYKDGVRLFSIPITATNFSYNGLVTGQSYNFQISSIDLSGNESALSAVQSFTSLDTVPPSVPFGLTALSSDSMVSIGWNAVTSNDLLGYYVFQDGVKISGLLTSNTYTISGLTNYQNYDFKVSAVDISGNESLLSSAVVGSPIPSPDIIAPDVPSNLLLFAMDSQISLSWANVTNVDLLGYFVYRDGVKLNSTPLITNKYIDNSVTNAVYYAYEISSIDHSGNESVKSVSVSASPVATNVPKVHVNFTLMDIVNGIQNWFSSIWVLLAFVIAIPLSFYIANRIKALY